MIGTSCDQNQTLGKKKIKLWNLSGIRYLTIFLNIIFFNFWKKRDMEREIVGEIFWKREMWKINSRENKWETIKKNEMVPSKVQLHVVFFLLLQYNGYFKNLRNHFREKYYLTLYWKCFFRSVVKLKLSYVVADSQVKNDSSGWVTLYIYIYIYIYSSQLYL